MRRMPRVALLIETARGYGRDLLRGIVRYARLQGPWGFYVTPGDFEQMLPRMRAWGGTGIIARIETPRVARAILESGLPTIALDLSHSQLRPGSSLARLSEVASDSHAAARLAAEHLLDRGLRHHAFVGIPKRIWSVRRQHGFMERLRQAGFQPNLYSPPENPRDRLWEREQAILARWLRALPKPVGVMACNDDRGREVLEACRFADLMVPDEVAVIGVDNDELLCELSDPPLTSVALDAESGGYHAAELLDRMMHRHIRSPQRLLVPPLRVITRRSTDILAQHDPDVRAALRFIQLHATRPIQVTDVVNHVLVARRSLEIRFKAALGRTIQQEIEHTRLDRARQFLLETDLPVARIAASVGFSSESYLAQVFRKHHRTTPAAFRRAHRAGQSAAPQPDPVFAT